MKSRETCVWAVRQSRQDHPKGRPAEVRNTGLTLEFVLAANRFF